MVFAGSSASLDSTDSLAPRSVPPVAIDRATQTLEIVLSLPSDEKAINSEAPNKCWLACRPGLENDIRTEKVVGNDRFVLDMSALDKKVASAKLALKVFLCDNTTGICTVVTKEQPVLFKDNEGDSIVKIDL